MASTEKTPLRPNDALARVAAAEADAAEPTPAEAVHELRDTLGRAWSEARARVNDLGVNLGSRAKNVGDETRRAASETRETLHDAIGEMSELGEEIAEDALELGRALGMSVSRFVRKHPIRSIAIAAVAGALTAQLLRGRRRGD